MQGYTFFKYIFDEPNKDNASLLHKLSDYVSHKIIGKNLTIEYLNSIDRKAAAQLFISTNKQYFERYIKSAYNLLFDNNTLENFEKDISIYIDFKIPYFYFRKKNKISSQDALKLYKGISTLNENIQYQYDESKKIDGLVYCEKNSYTSFWLKASYKQIKFLETLLKQHGYKLKVANDNLSMEDAKMLLSFFIDDIELEESFYNSFLEYI